MDSTIIRTVSPQISGKRGKQAPLDATDALALEAWSKEAHAVMAALHETGLDATSKARVHSRPELRRRLSKLMKRLHNLVDAVQPLPPPLPPPFPPPSASSDPLLEKLRLVSIP